MEQRLEGERAVSPRREGREFEEAFPFLANLERGEYEEFRSSATRVTLLRGAFICMEGDHCGVIPLLLNGTARVYKTSESGREITLYRIDPGESCILTASCILSDIPFPAFAVAESDVEALVIPSGTFNAWVSRSTPWRDFVFRLLSKRLSSVIEIVEEVAFQQLDARLAAYLLERMEGGRVTTTHEKIAADLGSSREVISRILKEFEREGSIALGRGVVEISDSDMLRRQKDD
ncbi:MAG: Crp/Fnr family transcriptional regulator [Candidatus Kapaibacterium sp.]